MLNVKKPGIAVRLRKQPSACRSERMPVRAALGQGPNVAALALRAVHCIALPSSLELTQTASLPNNQLVTAVRAALGQGLKVSALAALAPPMSRPVRCAVRLRKQPSTCRSERMPVRAHAVPRGTRAGALCCNARCASSESGATAPHCRSGCCAVRLRKQPSACRSESMPVRTYASLSVLAVLCPLSFAQARYH